MTCVSTRFNIGFGAPSAKQEALATACLFAWRRRFTAREFPQQQKKWIKKNRMIFTIKRNNLVEDEDSWSQVGAKKDSPALLHWTTWKREDGGGIRDKMSGGRERKEKRGCGAVCIIHTCWHTTICDSAGEGHQSSHNLSLSLCSYKTHIWAERHSHTHVIAGRTHRLFFCLLLSGSWKYCRADVFLEIKYGWVSMRYQGTQPVGHPKCTGHRGEAQCELHAPWPDMPCT